MENTNPTSSSSFEANTDADVLDEYDFRGGRRGVYAERYAEGTNLVKLDSDVAAVFTTPEAVNAGSGQRRSAGINPNYAKGQSC